MTMTTLWTRRCSLNCFKLFSFHSVFHKSSRFDTILFPPSPPLCRLPLSSAQEKYVDSPCTQGRLPHEPVRLYAWSTRATVQVSCFNPSGFSSFFSFLFF